MVVSVQELSKIMGYDDDGNKQEYVQYTVTIPIHLVRKLKLSKGDKLEVTVKDGGLFFKKVEEE